MTSSVYPEVLETWHVILDTDLNCQGIYNTSMTLLVAPPTDSIAVVSGGEVIL